MFQHILVPVDGSTLAQNALAHAIALAEAVGARISAFHVVTEFSGERAVDRPELAAAAGEAYRERAIAEAESILSYANRRARAHDVEVDARYVFSLDPHRAIVEEAERAGCDLIVMASHGRRGLQALLLGSETQKVLTHCRIPVLVVR